MAAVKAECPSVHTVVTGSRPASTIVDVSESSNVDMIVMATRAQSGLDRLWMGSVAERVVQYTDLPVFLLPLHDVPELSPA